MNATRHTPPLHPHTPLLTLQAAALPRSQGAPEPTTALIRSWDGAGTYIVDDLDLERRVARMHRETVGYYTEPRDHTRVLILGRGPTVPAFGAAAYGGPMRVCKEVYGYRRLSRANGQLLELCEAEKTLPPLE